MKVKLKIQDTELDSADFDIAYLLEKSILWKYVIGASERLELKIDSFQTDSPKI